MSSAPHSPVSLSPCLALLGAWLCATACTPGDDGGDTDAASATDPATDSDAPATDPDPTDADPTGTPVACEGASVDDCCCFELVPSGDESTPADVAVNCPSDDLCPGFTVSCGGPDDYQSTEPCTAVDDEAALNCALEALAGDKAGALQIEFYNTEFPGYWAQTLYLHVRGDGTAFVREDGFYDFSGEVGAVRHRTLQPPAVFEACLTAATVEEKVECLRGGWTGEAVATCTDAASYSLSDV